ncbi:MAG: hypothetical protein JNK00_10710 [Flavipsychrobacter sp.]|nr:hypothetical protein [Flavipsychrobacter sp.]
MNIYHLQYCDPHSVLLVNTNGLLRRIYTPFKVLTLVQIGNMPPGTSLMVDEVLSTESDELVYIIADRAYKYRYFNIVAKF